MLFASFLATTMFFSQENITNLKKIKTNLMLFCIPFVFIYCGDNSQNSNCDIKYFMFKVFKHIKDSVRSQLTQLFSENIALIIEEEVKNIDSIENTIAQIEECGSDFFQVGLKTANENFVQMSRLEFVKKNVINASKTAQQTMNMMVVNIREKYCQITLEYLKAAYFLKDEGLEKLINETYELFETQIKILMDNMEVKETCLASDKQRFENEMKDLDFDIKNEIEIIIVDSLDKLKDHLYNVINSFRNDKNTQEVLLNLQKNHTFKIWVFETTKKVLKILKEKVYRKRFLISEFIKPECFFKRKYLEDPVFEGIYIFFENYILKILETGGMATLNDILNKCSCHSIEEIAEMTNNNQNSICLNSVGEMIKLKGIKLQPIFNTFKNSLFFKLYDEIFREIFETVCDNLMGATKSVDAGVIEIGKGIKQAVEEEFIIECPTKYRTLVKNSDLAFLLSKKIQEELRKAMDSKKLENSSEKKIFDDWMICVFEDKSSFDVNDETNQIIVKLEKILKAELLENELLTLKKIVNNGITKAVENTKTIIQKLDLKINRLELSIFQISNLIAEFHRNELRFPIPIFESKEKDKIQ